MVDFNQLGIRKKINETFKVSLLHVAGNQRACLSLWTELELKTRAAPLSQSIHPPALSNRPMFIFFWHLPRQILSVMHTVM